MFKLIFLINEYMFSILMLLSSYFYYYIGTKKSITALPPLH